MTFCWQSGGNRPDPDHAGKRNELSPHASPEHDWRRQPLLGRSAAGVRGRILQRVLRANGIGPDYRPLDLHEPGDTCEKSVTLAMDWTQATENLVDDSH